MKSRANENPVHDEHPAEGLSSIVGLGSEIVGGGLTGAAAGFLVGGPAGAVVGGALAPVVKLGIRELMRRTLSRREQVRVSAAAQFALERYQALLDAGDKPRDDMPTSEEGQVELLEGVLQKARNSYQEKKVRLLANVLAGFAFMKGLSVEDAHAALLLVDGLTYRQLILLAVFHEGPRESFRKSSYRGHSSPPLSILSVFEEVYQLSLRGLVVNQPAGASQADFMLGWFDVTPADMRLTRVGTLVCLLAGVDVISDEDRSQVRGALQA